MKKEIKPLFTCVMLRPYAENPYVQHVSETGLKLTNGQFDNPDSGQIDEKDLYIQCAEVVEVGPGVKYVEVGDDVLYDVRTIRPVPFMGQGFLIVAEQNLVATIGDNLTEREKEWKQ